jgi:2-polyprenyl-3-methyl-5-hydroxy-6-metoxy-1,4-benzoquinol methylase
MNKNKVRVNEFDRWIGKIQTEKTIELGVGKSILDIGCGIGMYTPMFLKKFKRVVGLDPESNYLKEARERGKIEYIVGYGETYKTEEKFDTINMTMLLEHVDSPVKLLKHCKELLSPRGVIIIHVPNANSITRRLGVLMGVISSIKNITSKERNFYGHRRVYTMDSLMGDCLKAGLKIVRMGGLLYKPLPNEMLLTLCKKYGPEWTGKFIKALVKFGKDNTNDCANLWIVGE